jgi:hypothetical protein
MFSKKRVSRMKDRIITQEDIDDYDEELEILYCPMCAKVGLNIVLGHKILMPQEVKQPDYDDLLECSRCRYLCPIYQASPEDTIQDTVTTIENPFDNVSGQIVGAKKDSKVKRRKRFAPKTNKIVSRELERGADNVKVTDLND